MTQEALPAPRSPVERAKRCIRCGYDLRGHAGGAEDSDARCPECGLKAFWSLRAPQQLAQYPPGWVAAMSWGTRLLAAAYGFGFTVMILGFLEFFPKSETLAVGTFIALALLQAIGAWMLARQSGHYAERWAPINRWLLRLAPPLMVLGGVGILWIQHVHSPQAEWIVAGTMFAGMLAPLAVFIRLRAVAKMIADAGLAEHSTIVAWGFFATMVAIGAYSVWENVSRTVGLDVVRLIITAAVIVALLLFVLWGAFIMVCCVIDFGRAARVAQAEWKADEPPAT
jgi:DNA-directed RNA polymerase subunit RPC12/RpoP